MTEKDAGSKTREAVEAELDALYDAYQVDTIIDNSGFVILNGDTDLDAEDVRKHYCSHEAPDMEAEAESGAIEAVFVDYRDALPRTKKHYPLGAAGRAWRARRTHDRRPPNPSHGKTMIERLSHDWKAGLTATPAPKENDIFAESQGDAEDTVFDEAGILNFPDEVDFERILQEKLEDAAKEGCSDLERLEAILRRRRGAFATKFSECRISKLTVVMTM